MTRPDPEPERPAWAGAPGFHPQDDRPGAAAPPPAAAEPPSGFQAYPEQYAHAPMPGAPPYPALPPSPGPLSTRAPAARPGYLLALAAAGVWFVVDLVVTLVRDGRIGAGTVGVLVLVSVLAALACWLIARRRPLVFWQLVLVAAPCYGILRLLFPRQIG